MEFQFREKFFFSEYERGLPRPRLVVEPAAGAELSDVLKQCHELGCELMDTLETTKNFNGFSVSAVVDVTRDDPSIESARVDIHPCAMYEALGGGKLGPWDGDLKKWAEIWKRGTVDTEPGLPLTDDDDKGKKMFVAKFWAGLDPDVENWNSPKVQSFCLTCEPTEEDLEKWEKDLRKRGKKSRSPRHKPGKSISGCYMLVDLVEPRPDPAGLFRRLHTDRTASLDLWCEIDKHNPLRLVCVAAKIPPGEPLPSGRISPSGAAARYGEQLALRHMTNREGIESAEFCDFVLESCRKLRAKAPKTTTRVRVEVSFGTFDSSANGNFLPLVNFVRGDELEGHVHFKLYADSKEFFTAKLGDRVGDGHETNFEGKFRAFPGDLKVMGLVRNADGQGPSSSRGHGSDARGFGADRGGRNGSSHRGGGSSGNASGSSYHGGGSSHPGGRSSSYRGRGNSNRRGGNAEPNPPSRADNDDNWRR
jgi:hypothetical protein